LVISILNTLGVRSCVFLPTFTTRWIADANTLGQAKGTAKGGAPYAHIAAYKVCWSGGGCDDSDILAAMDEAVADGVDVFSASLGSDPPLYPFFSDSIAIASFHAISKGIVSVCSAGNAGPTPGSVTNVAPWIVTVGASSIDREFPSEVLTQDGQVITVSSLLFQHILILCSTIPLIRRICHKCK